MERNEISLHEVKIYRALKDGKGKWLTNADIKASIEGVSARTVRAHTLKLVRLGLIDQAEVFPAHRYRLSDKADKRNPAYTIRLEKAADVFGSYDM